MASGEDIGGVQDWFRSVDMVFCSIVMQEHCAHKVLSRVGRLGAIQFTDLNEDQTVFQRRYVNDVQRCDQVERKLRYLEEQLKKYNIPAVPSPAVEAFLKKLDSRQGYSADGRDQVNYMDNLETHVDEKEGELVQLNMYNSTLSSEFQAQKELQHVLRQAKIYAQENVTDATFDAQGVDVGGDAETGRAGAGAAGYEDTMRFRFIAGTVAQEDRGRFERMVFRSTRGNCLMRFYDIDDEDMRDPETNELVRKDVFICFFQAPYIENKIKRICDAFGAKLYQIPDLSNVAAIEDRLREVHEDIGDRERVLLKNEADIKVLLAEVAKFAAVWRWIAQREKSIYHTMNHFASDVAGVLRAEGWVVAAQKDEVIKTVMDAHSEAMGPGSSTAMPCSVNIVPEAEWPSRPPTHFKTNKFTRVFQVIVDTYGVPRYHEANPALMTVITFPFAFGIMFGDIGHGLLLFLFAAWIIWNEGWIGKLEPNEMLDMIYGGRYMILLMGFFATYCGGIYNDWFAMGLRIWPSKWIEVPPVGEPHDGDTIYFNPNLNYTYPFGVDPMWHRADNDLLYFNSLKMKMAVIFGVTHMMVGLIHRLQNALYFQDRGLMHNLDLWFEALPMIVFMMSLFGYMCFLILYKWSLDWLEPSVADGGTCTRINCVTPPALIPTLINIALSPGGLTEDNEFLYESQNTVQAVLLLLAVVMVPLMLIPKPYFLIKRMKKEHAGDHSVQHHNGASEASLQGVDARSTDELMLGDEHAEGGSAQAAPHAEAEGHGVGDIVIHQCIEAIEFTLGCISNTASYLRLWALSLAHSQLASVFLEKALLDFITGEGAAGALMTFVGYAVFAAITFAVLMCMDNMEAFLHALRLHWVEFQNKFFVGDGVAFTPLDFKAALTAGPDAE